MDLEQQFDYWMAQGLREDKGEKKGLEYFLQEYNYEEIYILCDEDGYYDLWSRGKLYDEGYTLEKVLEVANELYEDMHEDDYEDFFQFT